MFGRNKINGLRLLLALTTGLAASVLGIASYTARQLNGPRRRSHTDAYTFSPWEADVPHEPVAFAAVDGVVLRGWWFPRDNTGHVVIGLPGHRREKHELLGIGSALWRSGFNVLLFDFRGCGESDDAPRSLAYRELADSAAAVDFVSSRVDGARIGLIGYSMGAAVAILTAAVDERIDAIVVDSPFFGIREVISHAYRRRNLPVFPMVYLADIWNQMRFGYRYSAVRPADVIARIAPRHILLIHGENDEVSPVEDAMRLFSMAGEPKELWIVPNTQHVGSYFANRQQYVSRVSDFFNRALSQCAPKRGSDSVSPRFERGSA
ncbi:MAG: alpha/beta hydrolase [Chloroflexota bacterium]